MKLRSKTVLVTGASTGIGAATARAMAGQGARVLLVARSADKLYVLAKEIEAAGGSARAYPADVGDQHAVAELAGRVKSEVGVPDVIVNNAGAGRFLFIEEMLARGSGHIVNVNTPVAYAPWPGAIGYAGARWALRGFTEALRADLHGTGIAVSHVVPAKVASEYFEHNPGAEERIPQIAKLIRTLTPEQVADAIVATVKHKRRDVFVPLELRVLMTQERLLPRLAGWVVTRTGARRAHG